MTEAFVPGPPTLNRCIACFVLQMDTSLQGIGHLAWYMFLMQVQAALAVFMYQLKSCLHGMQYIASFTSHIVVCRSCSCGSPGFANFSELLGAFYNGVRQRLPDFKHGVDITAKVTFSDLRHSQDFLF